MRTIDELVTEIRSLALHINAATYRFLLRALAQLAVRHRARRRARESARRTGAREPA